MPKPHPRAGRIAAVFGGKGQGSGYLLSDRLVLTAAHLLGDSLPVVVVPGGGRRTCQVAWSRYTEDCDAALLYAEFDFDGIDAMDEPRWVDIGDLAPRPDSFAIGYPHAQRDSEGELDSEQLNGVLKPGSGLLTGRQVLDSLHAPPSPRPDGGSPWAGFSGAAVFHDGRIAGVVRADPQQWQHGRVILTPTSHLLERGDFHLACARYEHRVRSSVASPPHGDVFEEKLRSFVIRQHSSLHIIGLSRGGEDAESWPLDTSYLSLELLGGSPRPSEDEGQAAVSLRAEFALAGHRRVLVRGSAGSGKTTLLQWLATAAARRELPESLAELDDCVPLLIRLRSIAQRAELPSPEGFLQVVASPLAGHPGAAGWVTEQLDQGRVLLLVDGVDEVPEADRERTRRWLTELMDAYPDPRYVVTTRPSAVREGWLAQAGFTELELLPMSRTDVAEFIAKWHAAAGSDERHEQWRAALTSAVVVKPDLGRLATSPLMCALVCALNRDRNGYLPEGRMELYAAALEMLLVRRDRERGITAPDGLRLTVDQQTQLLQRLAYWLAKNGATEIDAELAVRKLEEALPAMPAISATAEQVLHHLLVRSGLLRQPTAETVDFVHRTFQDYLAAKAAVEDEDFGLLVGNAGDDQWADVIRMAVGHGRPRERARLLSGLLALNGDRFRLLAATCLEHATELDPEVRGQVTAAATALIPPRDEESAKALATIGPLVLDLLPGPEGLDHDTARAVVIAATTVAGDRSLPLLGRYVDHPNVRVRGQLAWAWDRFPTQEYGEKIIARLSRDQDLRYVASSREHLEFLRRLDGPIRLECAGSLSPTDLLRLPSDVEELRIHDNPHTVYLETVLPRARPGQLWLSDLLKPLDLAPIADSDLARLYLHWNADLVNADALAGATALRSLAIASRTRLQGLRLPPGLIHLRVARYSIGEDELVPLLVQAPALEYLYLEGAQLAQGARGVLDPLSRLRVLGEQLSELADAAPLPRLRELELLLPRDLPALGELVRVYPNLRYLRLEGTDLGEVEPLVLERLAGLHGCQVEIRRHVGPVHASAFGIGKEYIPVSTGFVIP